jgi:hypothetical protein
MKSKPFLLATAGATVDGRTIDDKMLREMASSYDPKTYTARLNIEHIRGISGDKPFRAYGDVLELSTGEVDVNFNGKTEKRLGLFGVLDVTDDAKQLNDAGQKVFPSIEIEPNFAGKGFAYLMGCALTDSPAAIATDRLQFNRAAPGVISVTADQTAVPAAAIEPSDAEAKSDEAIGVFTKFIANLSDKLGFNAPTPPVEPKPEPTPDDKPPFDMATFTKGLGDTLTEAFTKMGEATDAKVQAVTDKFAALEARIDATADPRHQHRPPADGPSGQYARTDC